MIILLFLFFIIFNLRIDAATNYIIVLFVKIIGIDLGTNYLQTNISVF